MRSILLLVVVVVLLVEPSLSDRPQLCEHRGCECLPGAIYIVECKNAELKKIPSTEELINGETGPYESDWLAFFDFNMITNITRLPSVEHLLTLSFRGNPIQLIEDMAFADLPKLRELVLAKARLTGEIFTRDAFKGLVNSEDNHDPLPLKLLDVSHNDIRHLDSHAFNHFNKLEVLIFSDNPINDLDPATCQAFYELERIVKLDLSRTGLKRIPETFFARMGYLEELRLSGNDFTVVPDDVNFIKSLKVLYLDFNPITMLQPSESYIHGPSKLSELSLSYMPQLTRIEAESFSNLQNLTVVHIANNPKLTFIHKMAFASSGRSMREVYLQNNSLSTLAEDMLDWAALERLDAQNNPWYCDCDMAWFAQLPLQNMVVQQPQLTEYVVCAKPENVMGENMKALVARDYEFVCATNTAMNPAYYGPLIVATIFTGALLLVASTVLCVYVLYHRSRGSGFSDQRVRYRRATLESNLESIAENVYS